MKDSDLIRIEDKHLVIGNIISEGGYGFIYNASEISEKDFIKLKKISPSPKTGEKTKKKGLYSKFIKGFKKKKEKPDKTLELKLKANKVKKGQQYALKKIITQNSERY